MKTLEPIQETKLFREFIKSQDISKNKWFTEMKDIYEKGGMESLIKYLEQ